MQTEYSEKYLTGRSKILQKKVGINNKFDLVIFTVGWEERCIEILKYDTNEFQIDDVIILSFKLNGENKDFEEKYMHLLKKFLREKKIHESEPILINNLPGEWSPNSLYDTTIQIREKINQIYKNKKKPLNIAVDLSNCPRRIFLYILGYCLKYDIAAKLSFFYSEAEYELTRNNYEGDKGDWRLVTIPDFGGEFNPEYNELFILSLGLDGPRYARLLTKEEPDNVGLLLPYPGVNEEYSNLILKQSNNLKEKFFIPNDNIIKTPVGDAIAVWKSLQDLVKKNPKYNITFLNFGPKPHVLGMGLYALLNEKIFMTYRIPKSGYNRVKAHPTGIFWQYDVENLIYK